MLNEEQRQKKLQKIQEFTLMDDIFMNACLGGDLELTELILRIVLDRNDLHVLSVESQRVMTNLVGRSIELDISATDDAGVEYNIEIQQADSDANPRRSRYHSSVIDAHALKKNTPFKALPETYVIFITKNDVLKGGSPIYFFERMEVKTGRPLGDGTHIVYVNGADKNAETALGRLMNDLQCANPDKMFYKPIADKVRYLKETDEGEKIMTQVMDDWMQEIVNETSERKDLEYAQKLIQFGVMTLEDIANLTTLPLEKVQTLANEINA